MVKPVGQSHAKVILRSNEEYRKIVTNTMARLPLLSPQRSAQHKEDKIAEQRYSLAALLRVQHVPVLAKGLLVSVSQLGTCSGPV